MSPVKTVCNQVEFIPHISLEEAVENAAVLVLSCSSCSSLIVLIPYKYCSGIRVVSLLVHTD
jgi:formate dehydrogenase maturation protein FdhE